MSFSVDEATLDDLASRLRRLEEGARQDRRSLARQGHDTGEASAAHDVALARWKAGLGTGADALRQAADEVTRCAARYRGSDDAAGVRFTGIPS